MQGKFKLSMGAVKLAGPTSKALMTNQLPKNDPIAINIEDATKATFISKFKLEKEVAKKNKVPEKYKPQSI